MSQPRVADDFEAIHKRLDEIRAQQSAGVAAEAQKSCEQRDGGEVSDCWCTLTGQPCPHTAQAQVGGVAQDEYWDYC